MKARVVTIITLATTLGWMGGTAAAQIRETYHGNSGKQIYILEDIHGDYQVQLSHVKVLTQLIKRCGLQLVATEGATGYICSLPLENGSLFSSERLAAANTLLQNNQLNAAYLIQTLTGQNLTVVGVEGKKSYALHLQIAQKIAGQNDAVQKELNKIAPFAKNGELAYLKKVFSLRANRAIVDDWKTNPFLGKLQGLLASLPAALQINQPLLEKQAKAVEAYYSAALARDAALAENTLDRMGLEQANVAALIVGGFHTQGITEILRQNGISYTVLTPE